MGDYDNDILADPTGLAGITSSADDTATKAADTGETPATTEPAPPGPVYEDDYETPEAVENVLRNEWGDDFETKYEDASKAVQQFFKGDNETLEWLSQRVGNHPVAVKIALRLAAIYSGNGLPQKTAGADTAALDAQLKDFEKGGKHFDAWLGGDKKLNDHRIRLYSQRYKGRVTIE
jgi:hypothetical protein